MVNVQTEHQDNHTARLTVEVEPERVEQAMRKAASRLAKKGRIPGFRPGKAPYNLVLNLYGREYVLSEALEEIGNAIYKEALDASGVEPYAMGSLNDVQEEGRKLVFIVPKRPTVDLGDYRSLRIESETPEVTDEMVTRAVEDLRQAQAVLEPVERPAKLSDLVTFEHILIGVLGKDGEEIDFDEDDEGDDGDLDDEDEDEDVEDDEDDDDLDDEEDDEDEDEGDEEDEDGPRLLFHEHNFDRVLRDDEEDFFPGFSAQIVGLTGGEAKVFDLVMPDEFASDQSIAGRTVRFDALLSQVQARTVPDWTDDLARRIANDETKTMIDLRVDVRKQLQDQAENTVRQQLAGQAIDKLIEDAAIHYPEELVQEYTTDLIEDLEHSVLNRQGLTLKDFLRVTGDTEESLRQRYRDAAERRAKRALILGEIVRQEKISVSDGEVDSEIDRMSGLIGGEQSANFRNFLTTPQSRFNIGMDLTTNRAIDRLVAIVRGENPPIAQPEADEAAAPAEEEAPAAAPEPAQETGEPTTNE